MAEMDQCKTIQRLHQEDRAWNDIAYNFLVSKIDKVIFQLEARTTEFLDLLHLNE